MSQIGQFVSGGGGSSSVLFLAGNDGIPVGPDIFGIINVVGGNNIYVSGTPGTSTETIDLVGTTDHAVQIGNASGSLTSISVGTNGQVLIGATGADPAFATLTSPDSSITFTPGANSLGLAVTGGTSVGKTITGNTGGALSPTAGNWNIITANSIPKFAGAVSTLTLDFALTDNLLLGSSGSITTGNTNVGYGKLAADSISSGASNAMIGYEAGVAYTTGSNTTAVGAFAMFSSVAGASNNTAIGYSSLYNLAGAGTNNTCLGLNSATAYTTTESNNIVIGSTGVIADNNRIRIGTNGTHTSTFITGIDGVNVGSVAKVITMASDQLGTATITAGSNVTVTPGANTITISASGSASTITGNTGGALSPTAGNWNIVTANSTVKFAGAVSTETLDFNLNNLVLGSSLPAAAGPQNNVGMGSDAMAATTSAADNVCIGYQAGKAITTGSNSVIVGSQAGLNLTTGTANTAVGNLALSSATTGAGNAGSNTALGASTLGSLTTGVENDVLGRGAAPNLVTGSYNTIIGSSAGATVAGAAYTSSESSNLLISNTGVVGESNKIRIGTSGSGQGQQNACYIAGIDGVNVGSVSKVLTMASDQLGTATITAGTNITVTPTANTITIACTGGTGITFSVITADQTAAVNNGYICNKGTLLTLTLPTTSAVGSIIECTGMNIDLGWKIAQNASQIIHFGTSDTSTGTGGSLASSKKRDSVRMVCVVANLEWNVLSSVGNITIV